MILWSVRPFYENAFPEQTMNLACEGQDGRQGQKTRSRRHRPGPQEEEDQVKCDRCGPKSSCVTMDAVFCPDAMFGRVTA